MPTEIKKVHLKVGRLIHFFFFGYRDGIWTERTFTSARRSHQEISKLRNLTNAYKMQKEAPDDFTKQDSRMWRQRHKDEGIFSVFNMNGVKDS